MDERILAALDALSARGTWLATIAVVAMVFAWGLTVVWFGRLRSYHDEKGKNLATKEDVEKITRITEQVRQDVELSLEANSQQNRLQLAALDKRLEAHQAAFRVWHRLTKAYGATDAGKAGKVNDDEVQNALAAWNDLWEGQSLYLDKETRAAVFRLPSLHRDRVSKVEETRKSRTLPGLSVSPQDPRRDAAVEASMLQGTLQFVDEDIRDALALIEQGVHLPALRTKNGSSA